MDPAPDPHARTEVRDRMRITWHQPIAMDDGLVLRADVYRPVEDGRCPVILTYGIYAKGLAYQDGYPLQWEKMVADYPEILAGSTNKYQNWETTDPERWVPHGYAVVRVDSRGAGWSPGFMDPASPKEIDDLYQCIEWAGTQPWSNGKVGMLGISYYAGNQWRVAGRHPPHLAAIIPWEGQNDRYRDSGYHGGILCQFQERWAKHQVANIQYGRGDRAKRNPNTGESVAGPVTLSDEELAKNRVDAFEELKKHPLDDEWHRSRSADLSLVRTPLLTCANWGGQGIHPRGNFNGYTETPEDTPKWLEAHGDSHWSLFSTDYGFDLQKRFFDYFLKGIQNGWDGQPRVQLNIRHPSERFVLRRENEWPLARTQWTKMFLGPNGTLAAVKPVQEGTASFDNDPDLPPNQHAPGVVFCSALLDTAMELTGPVALYLNACLDQPDATWIVTLRDVAPDGSSRTVTKGWLRASQRELDAGKSRPHQPYQKHLRREVLEPGRSYEYAIEIRETSNVFLPGHRIALDIKGQDTTAEDPIWVHTCNAIRTRHIVQFGGKFDSHLLLPVIPG
ncbi:MAG: CocE/NonD family hydrolase [Betaproteobacteria bacterium]|nr:CocE/NonD family hydrolase [Betaproteobacteria bacterium]